MNIQNRHTKIFKLKTFVAFVLFFSFQLFLAQNSVVTKFKKEYALKNNKAYFKLDATYTNIIFKTWNKNYILVNAFVTGKNQSGEELKLQANQWNLEVTNNDTLVDVISNGFFKPANTVSATYNISGNISQEQLSKLVRYSIAPLLKNLQNNPIPVALQNSLDQLKFDYNAYNKLGETYLKIWEHNLVKNMDAASANAIKKWSSNATSNLQQVSNLNRFPQQKSSTAINENFTIQLSQSVTTQPQITEAKKNLEVYLPVNARLLFKTKYGKVVVADELINAKAEMKYTPFKAEKISGEKTNLFISFAPVQIKEWNSGSLSLGYVKHSRINQARDLNLYNTSSTLNIESLNGKTAIESLFGIITISELHPGFSDFSVMAKNSDIAVALPQTAYNFAYNGNRSYIEVPQTGLTLNALGNKYDKMLNGYSISRNTEKIYK